MGARPKLQWILNLLQVAGFQHVVACVHFTVNLVVTINYTDAFHFCAHFQGGRRAFDLEVFDKHDRIAVS